MTSISQEQQAMSDESFQAELRVWLAANITDEFREKRNMTFQEKVAVRRAWQKKLCEAGWIGIGWPKEYGGRGASLMKETIYNEEMARAQAPATANVIGLNMVGCSILAVGTAEQKARYLREILSAEEIWCQGFSEPNAGSDVASLQTRAVREGDHFVVNGQKVWTSYGYVADFCILLVRTDFESPKHKGLSDLIVDMKSPGVSSKPLVQMTGEAEFAELFFENVKVPVENLVGQLLGVEQQCDIERRIAEMTEQELLEEWGLKLVGCCPETGPSRRKQLGRCNPHLNTSWTKVSPSGVSAG